MRSERLYLKDILAAAEAIANFSNGLDAETFYHDALRQSAILHQLMIIGEATARISPELRDRYPEVAWRDIVAFRNIVVHGYFSLDLKITWDTVTEDVPALRRQVAAILEEEAK